MSLIRANALAIPLRDQCVQCVVTSPPYWGLRDYGIAGQLGLESTPEAYTAQIVAVFAEVRRVLKPDGVAWLNLGDSYATGAGGVGECPGGGKQGENWKLRGLMTPPNRLKLPGLKPKDLVGIPWRVAFALQAAGWYLRSDIIWSKPNPMPESVTDRPTKAHEYIFLLTKSPRYYYDTDAIREPHKPESLARYEYGLNVSAPADGFVNAGAANLRAIGHCERMGDNINAIGRNKRSVWHVAIQPYADAHFATFPEALVEPCILAGSRVGDLCFDPFIGSGTVGKVCDRLMRRWVGTDLTYQHLARARTAQMGLRVVNE